METTIQGLGFRDLGLRVYGLGLRAEGLAWGFRVAGLGFGI